MCSDAITVIGAGGIGCAVGYAFLATGTQVDFIESDVAKVNAGNEHGVGVEGRPRIPAQFIPFSEWQPEANRLHLLCTKCYDNAAVLSRLPADATIIPIQNGFDAELDKAGHATEGIASFVSECGPGRPITRITRAGDLHLGGRGSAPPAWLRELAEKMGRAKLFRVIEVADILPIKHTKLMYNAAISPLAAAAGFDNGQLLTIPNARRLFFALLQENYAILKAANKPLGKVGPFHPDTVMRILAQPWLARALAWAFAPGLRGTYCSMSGDIEKNRTEIWNYNGQLVQWAGSMPCPLNRAAVDTIEYMAEEKVRPNLDALAWFDN
jgi:2-dehydropantoate 2-reductase